MKLQFRKLLTAGLLALVAVSTPALSQDTGWYVGLGVGQSKFDVDCTGTTSCDDKDTAWSIFGGYQFNKHFGAELGYVDLGKVTASGPVLGVPVSLSIKTKAFELLGVGTYPINQQFSVYGKLGFFRWDVDASASALGASASDSDSGTDFTHAIGVKYNFTKTIAGTLQWQRYYNIGSDDTTGGTSDVDVIGVGIIFKF